MKREWLINSRKSQGLKQAQVASRAFIDRAYYSQIETGKRNPSFNVAINIAAALNFDPIIFFRNNLSKNTLQNEFMRYEIVEHFKRLDNGKILYLYNSLDDYYHHVITFLISGIEKNSYCLIIDNYQNYNKIQQNLETILSKSELINSVCFINKADLDQHGPKEIIDKLSVIQSEFENAKTVRIWLSEKKYCQDDWLHLVENPLKKNGTNNMLLIRAYKASMISADLHIEMMKTYPYLMTDSEIVGSPFYHASI
ncbi:MULTISPECIES: helix-turn-helix domain-containing protein [Paraliobacillus]|uniref:helix-turn-helix domain-containing protein n=1 Tax=Paraliobacillus TaxID=200903 RepID=UPI000DD3EDB9|nr:MULTISPECIES: helix-turn-helix domain-containing protein [Paraliobacillus]